MFTRGLRIGTAVGSLVLLFACSTSSKRSDASLGSPDGPGEADLVAGAGGTADAPLATGGATGTGGPRTGGNSGVGGAGTAGAGGTGGAGGKGGTLGSGGGAGDSDAGALRDSAVTDTSTALDARDANPANDLGVDRLAAVDSAPCLHEFDNPSCWAIQDLSVVHPNGTLLGGIYDGKRVYFPGSIRGGLSGWWNGNTTGVGQMLSYDPRDDFRSDSSWTVFSTPDANPAAFAFAGAVFDGRYIYYPPFNPSGESVALRYDTGASFTEAASWASADLHTFNGAFRPVGYVGGTFDGRYVYFVPNCFYEYWNGLVLRYDVQGTFADKASWSVFDTQKLDYDAGGFIGVAFDGRYLYFAPWGDLSSNTAHRNATPITRFDTRASFTDATSWTIFDALKLSPTAGFGGAVFDGRFVYFLPGDYQSGDVVLRYDTKADFASSSSWTGFSVGGVARRTTRFMGGVFDGRYLYLVPTATGDVAVRYDTTAEFSAASSWAAFDVKGWDARAEGFGGGVFDGRYVYLVPAFGHMIVRFDAYSTPVTLNPLPASFL